MILLVTDWLPVVTRFFSCTYARNGRAVTRGNHVKICVWLPTNPITTWLTGAVTTVTTVTSVFLYIYGFFWGSGQMAGRFWINPMQSNPHDNPPPARVSWEQQNPCLKFWLVQIGGIFGGMFKCWENKTVNKQSIKSPVWVSPSHHTIKFNRFRAVIFSSSVVYSYMHH